MASGDSLRLVSQPAQPKFLDRINDFRFEDVLRQRAAAALLPMKGTPNRTPSSSRIQ